MQPHFNETMAKQHMEQLQREALTERNAARLQVQSRRREGPPGAEVHWHSLGLLHLYWARVVSSFGRTVIIHQLKANARQHAEVQPELQMTFTAMCETHPKYDGQFIQHIVQSLEEQLDCRP